MRLRCFLALGLCLGLATSAVTQTARLAGVRVTGSKRFAEADIIRASGLKLGAEASLQTFQEAADRLAATGVFAEVVYQYAPAGTGVTVEFRVTDATQLLPCGFENFVWFSEKELQAELRSRVPLFTGQLPSTGSLLEQVVAALDGLLTKRGVKGHTQYLAQGPRGGPIEAILFRVEGVVSPIRQVEFPGATQLDISLLQAASQPLLESDYQQSFVRAFAERNLRPIYLQQGYLRVAFTDPVAELIADVPREPAVAVAIPLTEGLQYDLAEVHWSGNNVFPSSELAKCIQLAPGKPANAVQLQYDLQSIHDLYATRGYLRAVIHPKPVFDDAQRTVTFELRVREGDLYRMGKLEITGLDSARTEKLQRGWRLRPGEPFDASYLKRFLDENAPYLPYDRENWTIKFQRAIEETTKTVNVSIHFLHKQRG